MVAFSRLSALRPPAVGRRAAALLPTGGGLLAALGAGATVMSLPIGLLERLVWTSGVATLLPAAQPPLGATARACLALGAATVTGAVAWSLLFLLFGPGGLMGPRADADADTAGVDAPRVRRGDSHPDAPPRPPMTAADLGTPLMERAAVPPRVQPLPADLDQSLAAFDPAAVPASPLAPAEPLAPLAPRWAVGERIETFQLVPPAPMAEPASASATPARRKEGPPSIDTLLRRLEEHAGRRVAAR